MPTTERKYFHDFVAKAQKDKFRNEIEGLNEYRERLKKTKIQDYNDDASLTMSSMTDVKDSIQAYIQAVASNKTYQNAQ